MKEIENRMILEEFKSGLAKDWGCESWQELLDKEEIMSFSPQGIENLLRNVIKKAKEDKMQEIRFVLLGGDEQ